MAAFRIDLRLMIAHPENFGRSTASQRGVCCDFDQTLCADFFGNFRALRSGSLVAPDDGTAQDLAVFIEHDKTVHLSGQADALDILGRNAGLLHDGADGPERRIAPVSRFLLCVAVFGLIKGILDGVGGDDLAGLIKQYGLGAAGTEVYADNICHFIHAPFSDSRIAGIGLLYYIFAGNASVFGK